MDRYPPANLDHLLTLTDTTGVIQHAIYQIPNRKTGYTSDDNARALTVALMYDGRFPCRESRRLISTYLSFLHYAQRSDGKFRNYMGYEQNFTDAEGSNDCFGRSVEACAYALCTNVHPNTKRTARHMFDRAWPRFSHVESPRGWAHLVSALYRYLTAHPDQDDHRRGLAALADQLVSLYREVSQPGWRWFEDILAYDNGLLPQALFMAYHITGVGDYLQVAEESLEFLSEVMIEEDCLQPVGSSGWFQRGGERARFDQQPIDADSFIQACLWGHQATGKSIYQQRAVLAFDWFHGRNVHELALYDPSTGGCFDGLTPEGVNQNQGAESVIVYLLSYLTLLPPETTELHPVLPAGAIQQA